ncbi:MAG: hypothetical protein ABIW82_08820 [Dokdonella sp.]
MIQSVRLARAALVLLVAFSMSTTSSASDTSAMRAFQIERSVVQTLTSYALKRSYDIYVKLPEGYD